MSYQCRITLQSYGSLISDGIYWKTFSGVIPWEYGGLQERSYARRLSRLSAFSLERSCELTDLFYAYKIIHGLVGLFAGEEGTYLKKDVTRDSDFQLAVLHARTERVKFHFKYSIATLWNEFSLSIVSIPRYLFRRALYNHFMSKEEWHFSWFNSELIIIIILLILIRFYASRNFVLLRFVCILRVILYTILYGFSLFFSFGNKGFYYDYYFYSTVVLYTGVILLWPQKVKFNALQFVENVGTPVLIFRTACYEYFPLSHSSFSVFVSFFAHWVGLIILTFFWRPDSISVFVPVSRLIHCTVANIDRHYFQKRSLPLNNRIVSHHETFTIRRQGAQVQQSSAALWY